MFKRLLQLLLLGIIIIAGIILFNTVRFRSVQPAFTPVTAIIVSDSALAHFQMGLRFKTISFGDKPADSIEFTHFHQYLQKTYPLIYSKLERKVVATYSLIFKWAGKDTLMKPVVLMAHQDVVPVEKDSLTPWMADPFSGVIKDGKIWGRGAVDDKMSLFGILEATERLLADGFRPQQTIYFVFGHDEEVGGTGALAAASYFKDNDIKPAWVLDEGGEITIKEIQGLKNIPVALIGTAEKGYLSVDLSVNIPGGHSSMPKAETAINVLISGLQHLKNNPFQARFTASSAGTFDYLGPEMPFVQKMVIANRWLFKSLLISLYEKSPSGNAIVRTTSVPTIIQSGVKDNVVPTYAHAVVNFRILPGTSANDVLKHVEESIQDKRITISKPSEFYSEASHETSVSSRGFQKLAQTIRSCYPGSIVAPLLCVGATDSRKFENLTDCVLRFSPATDLEGMHGINENVAIEEYKKAINFYYHLLKS